MESECNRNVIGMESEWNWNEIGMVSEFLTRMVLVGMVSEWNWNDILCCCCVRCSWRGALPLSKNARSHLPPVTNRDRVLFICIYCGHAPSRRYPYYTLRAFPSNTTYIILNNIAHFLRALSSLLALRFFYTQYWIILVLIDRNNWGVPPISSINAYFDHLKDKI